MKALVYLFATTILSIALLLGGKWAHENYELQPKSRSLGQTWAVTLLDPSGEQAKTGYVIHSKNCPKAVAMEHGHTSIEGHPYIIAPVGWNLQVAELQTHITEYGLVNHTTNDVLMKQRDDWIHIIRSLTKAYELPQEEVADFVIEAWDNKDLPEIDVFPDPFADNSAEDDLITLCTAVHGEDTSSWTHEERVEHLSDYIVNGNSKHKSFKMMMGEEISRWSKIEDKVIKLANTVCSPEMVHAMSTLQRLNELDVYISKSKKESDRCSSLTDECKAAHDSLSQLETRIGRLAERIKPGEADGLSIKDQLTTIGLFISNHTEVTDGT